MGNTARKFEQMQERLAGAKGSGAKASAKATPVAVREHETILGVDPSLRGTGYGVIRVAKPHPIAVTHGTISIAASWERSRCLAKIYATLRDVIAEHKPTVCVLEGLFFAQN